MRRGTTPGSPMEIGLKDGTVTALVCEGGDCQRVTVYLDGRRAFDLSAAVVAQAGIRKDDTLTVERQLAALKADEPARARHIALVLVARREVCSAEVTKKLVDRGIEESVAQETVAWLQERDYVNDHRYAAAYAREKLKAGWGRQRIVGELTRKGIDRAKVAGEAWEELVEPGVEARSREELVGVLRRRFGGQLGGDPAGTRRRVSGYLARRGHDWETISAVWQEFAAGAGDS